MSGQPTQGQNNKATRCRAGREYRDKETEEVTMRVQCGYPKKHTGPHTFEEEQKAVTVKVYPVQVPKMKMRCPGCGCVVDQLIPIQMAQAINNNAEPHGHCQQCGHPVRFCKQQLVLARR
jgi:hypothetical protein